MLYHKVRGGEDPIHSRYTFLTDAHATDDELCLMFSKEEYANTLSFENKKCANNHVHGICVSVEVLGDSFGKVFLYVRAHTFGYDSSSTFYSVEPIRRTQMDPTSANVT